jgi:hypothetical protein
MQAGRPMRVAGWRGVSVRLGNTLYAQLEPGSGIGKRQMSSHCHLPLPPLYGTPLRCGMYAIVAQLCATPGILVPYIVKQGLTLRHCVGTLPVYRYLSQREAREPGITHPWVPVDRQAFFGGSTAVGPRSDRGPGDACSPGLAVVAQGKQIMLRLSPIFDFSRQRICQHVRTLASSKVFSELPYYSMYI